jgi:hypothetical protein
MFFVFRISDSFQILFISVCPADVLRRCTAFTGYAPGVLFRGLGQQDRFQQQIVPPVVPEVVYIQ